MIVGDTLRWHTSAENAITHALLNHCEIRRKHDFVDAVSELIEHSQDIDLIVAANHLGQPNEGLRLAHELNETGDPPLIIFSNCIDAASRRAAEAEGAVVVPFDQAQLEQAVQLLLPLQQAL